MKVPRERPLSLKLLGPPEVCIGGESVRFVTKKALALLCYLAAEGGRHTRSELAELLWPGGDERRSRTDLRSALAKLRKALGEDGIGEEELPFLIVDGAWLGIEPSGIGFDLGRA